MHQPSDSNTVLFALQRLEKGKRVDILLKAVARMVREGISIHLYVGGDGRKRRELELLRDTLGLSDHVTFAGHIPDEALPGYYRMADIFVLHSSYETFGVVLAEAMATGKPIVSVTAGGIPDVVEPGSEGLLVPPLDPDALAQALMRLVGDSALRLRMGRAGREKAVRLFAWERIVAQYEEALDCVIARGAAARRRKVARHGANTT